MGGPEWNGAYSVPQIWMPSSVFSTPKNHGPVVYAKKECSIETCVMSGSECSVLGNVPGNCDGQDLSSTLCLPELISPSARIILLDVYSIPLSIGIMFRPILQMKKLRLWGANELSKGSVHSE